MSTWRKSGLANYKKRHSELSKRFHIGWIYIYIYIPGGSFIREYSQLELFTQEGSTGVRANNEKTCFHDRLTIRRFGGKENRMSVRNGHVYGCMGFPFPFTFERNIPFPTWKIPHYSSSVSLSFPFFFQIILVFQQFSFYIYIYME